MKAAEETGERGVAQQGGEEEGMGEVAEGANEAGE